MQSREAKKEIIINDTESMKINKKRAGSYKRKKMYQSVFLGGGVIIILLLVWELAAYFEFINATFSSSPTRIMKSMILQLRAGSLWVHIKASGKIFLLGYAMAVFVGVPFGILMGWFEKINMAFSPLIAAFHTVPRIALMPLFIIWFGLGISSKLALIFLSAVFPLIINMQTSVSNLDKDLTKVAVVYGANQRQIFFTIALPQSVPFLITALRLAAGRSLVGVVGAEVFGGAEGLGYLIQYAGATFQTDKVFVCVIVLAVFGITLDKILQKINRRFDGWRNSGI